MKKKLRLKAPVKNIIAVIGLYAILIFGVIAINARFEVINEQQKSANEPDIQIAQNLNR